MKNLAGVPECDGYIQTELEKARITAVPCELTRSEVPYRLTGQLGQFHFWRAWYYWVATGLMPLEIAKELYADPIGKSDIRVAGHCACPPPEDPWLKYVADDGVELVRESERADFEKCFKKEGEVAKLMKERNFRFSADRVSEGKAYVDCYHIDSQEGLRLFADTIRNRIGI